MDEERKPWEQMIEQGESAKWFSRFDRFRLMKPWERSVNAVFVDEQTKNPKKPEKTRTNSDKEWYRAAHQWKWDERAAAYDKSRLDARDKQIAAEEAEVLRSEYALKHERVRDLNQLAKLLKEEVFDEKKRWADDVKAVGIEAHYIKKFNDALTREYRAALEDIAKEKSERIKKQEVTGKDGTPLLPGQVGFYEDASKAVELPKKTSLDTDSQKDSGTNVSSNS